MIKKSTINLKAFFKGFTNELVKQAEVSQDTKQRLENIPYKAPSDEPGFIQNIFNKLNSIGDDPGGNKDNDSMWNPLNWNLGKGIDSFGKVMANPAASGGAGAGLGALASVLYNPNEMGWHNLIGSLARGAGGAALGQFWGKPTFGNNKK